MDFRGLVWKRVWKITFFGLKSGQDLKNRAAHPHVDFPGVPPFPPRACSQAWKFKLPAVYLEHCFLQYTAVWAVWIDSVRINKMEVIRNPTRSLHPWFKCLTRRTSMWRLRHVTADNTKMTTKTTCLHVQFSVPCWTVFTSLKTRSKLEERKRLQIFSPWTGNLQHCPVPCTAECTKGFVCGCCGTKVSSKKLCEC